jgi:hypothetical protein
VKHYAWRQWKASDPKRLAKETRHIIEGPESSLLIFGEEDQVARESQYQADLIQRLYAAYPGCFIQKLDSSYTQGIPDLLILFRDRWAVLEVKAAFDSAEQPNQRWYVEKMDAMSFAAFIYPENEEEVLRGLEQALRPARAARVSQRKQVPLDQLRRRSAS